MTTSVEVDVLPPSMLVRFVGENIRSFRDRFEVSFVATSVAEKHVVRHLPWRTGDGPASQVGLLPVAGFFGANASGKSNVIRALSDMRTIVLNSFRNWSDEDRTHRHPFRLDTHSPDAPSLYEVEVILGGVLHKYGFSLDDRQIVREWAYRYPRGREQRIFDRDEHGIAYGSSAATATVSAGELVRSNALLLSTAVAFRGSELQPLHDWFGRNLLLAEADNRNSRQVFTVKQMQDPVRKRRVLALLRAADLGVVDVTEVDITKVHPNIREKVEQIMRILNDGQDNEDVKVGELGGLLRLMHRGSDGEKVAFTPDDESLGTVVWLGLAGPIVDALEEGSVLLADELDASLHPVLVEQVIRLFQDPASNPNRAQLVFNSHDSHLLGDTKAGRILGRDQIWFTEKTHDGSSSAYPLSDLSPRKEEAIAKRYLAGRYGAVPIVAAGDFIDASQLEHAH